MIVHEIPCDTCIHRDICKHKVACENMRDAASKSLEYYDANTFTFSIHCKYFEKSKPLSREGKYHE